MQAFLSGRESALIAAASRFAVRAARCLVGRNFIYSIQRCVRQIRAIQRLILVVVGIHCVRERLGDEFLAVSS